MACEQAAPPWPCRCQAAGALVPITLRADDGSPPGGHCAWRQHLTAPSLPTVYTASRKELGQGRGGGGGGGHPQGLSADTRTRGRQALPRESHGGGRPAPGIPTGRQPTSESLMSEAVLQPGPAQGAGWTDRWPPGLRSAPPSGWLPCPPCRVATDGSPRKQSPWPRRAGGEPGREPGRPDGEAGRWPGPCTEAWRTGGSQVWPGRGICPPGHHPAFPRPPMLTSSPCFHLPTPRGPSLGLSSSPGVSVSRPHQGMWAHSPPPVSLCAEPTWGGGGSEGGFPHPCPV